MSRNYLDICSFEGLHPIVCCPPLILKEIPIEAKQTIKYSNLANKSIFLVYLMYLVSILS